MQASFVQEPIKPRRVVSSNLVGCPFSTMSQVGIEMMGVLNGQPWISTPAFPLASAKSLFDKSRQRETHMTRSVGRGTKGTCIAMSMPVDGSTNFLWPKDKQGKLLLSLKIAEGGLPVLGAVCLLKNVVCLVLTGMVSNMTHRTRHLYAELFLNSQTCTKCLFQWHA